MMCSISLNPHSTLLRQMLLFPFYSWDNRGLQKLSHLPKEMCLVRGRFQNMVTWFQSSHPLHPPKHPSEQNQEENSKSHNFFFFLKKKFYYLSAPGLSCGTQDLRSLLWPVGSSSLIQPGPPPLGVQSLSLWTTWDVSRHSFLMSSLTIEDQLGICLQLT